MPSVGSNNPRARDAGTYKQWSAVYGKDAGSWTPAKRVYARVSGSWVEVWNARPEVSSVAVSSASASAINLTGVVDANNLSTTTSFAYSGSAGTSGTVSSTTVSSNSPTTVTAAPSVGNPWQLWSVSLSATNAVQTTTATGTSLDCRQHDAGGSGWSVSGPVVTSQGCTNSSGCASSQLVYTYTYTKSGCPSYTRVTYGACAASDCSNPGGAGWSVIASGTEGCGNCQTRTYTTYSKCGCSNYTAYGACSPTEITQTYGYNCVPTVAAPSGTAYLWAINVPGGQEYIYSYYANGFPGTSVDLTAVRIYNDNGNVYAAECGTFNPIYGWNPVWEWCYYSP